MADVRLAATKRATAVLLALRDFGPAEIAKSYRPDCCIDATAIIIDVLDFASITARALCTKLNIYNKSALDYLGKHGKPAFYSDPPEMVTEWQESGCKWVGVGYPTGEPGGYSGHLIAVARFTDHCLLIDLSISQANRPASGIEIPPHYWRDH